MNSSKILDRLKEAYPNKKVIALPTVRPTEILCEVDPSSEHPEYSVAVSIVDGSTPHYHKKSTETYTILEGELDLFIDGHLHHMKKGESVVVHPLSNHYATGRETWIECRSEPGWTAEDHVSSLSESGKA